MNIGILCFWGVPNYGAWAQAYALNNIVKSIVSENDTVQHIAWLNPCHEKNCYGNDYRRKNSFYYNYKLIPHTKTMSEKELENAEFDLIITGSDAIWQFNDYSGYDAHLIGNRLNCKRLISYAASCGDMEDNFPRFIYDGLLNYDAISVRDIHSQNIVSKIANKDSELVLDPTLVWNFKNDINIFDTIYNSYILVYGNEWDEQLKAEVIAFAKQNNLKTISVGWINEWCDMSLRFIEIRALEWIGLFKEAAYVVTSTFHGLMFSINFDKQVFFNQVSYVKNRSEYLLTELGIQSLYENPLEVVPNVINKGIDYTQVNKKLEVMREKSLEYLKRNIMI